ncbi:tripartite tricarboxylate transporter TctB family protein [Bosea sp. NPDC055332]
MQDGDQAPSTGPAEIVADDQAVRATGDILAGLLFAALGIAALLIGRAYPVGSSLDMGPGYLPRVVAGALVLTGLVVMIRGMRLRAFRWPDFPLRAMGWIAAAILLFAGLVERTGLFLACLVCILVAALGDPQPRWREVPVVAVLFAGFCALLFGYLLKLPVRVWPL